VAQANALPKAAADLCQMVKTRIRNRRRVFTWFASRWRNHQLKQAEKPHSKFSSRKTLDGPATRPKTPLAVENSVGKLAADQAPNASTGRATLAVPRTRDQPNERRRKAGQNERSNREGHEVSAEPVKTFRNVGDVKNDTAGL
jgi:hypothetical protein